MQHCQECGADLPNDALFCGRCGNRTASENVLTTNTSDATIDDIPMSHPATSMGLNELQDSPSANEQEEGQESPEVLTGDDVEEEPQTQQEYRAEPTGSVPEDLDPEPAIPSHQLSDESQQYIQTPLVAQETYSPRSATNRSGTRPVSKCLLFSLAGLLIFAGVFVALLGLFHMHLPGTSGSSTANSNSSLNDFVKTTGSSLNALICVKSSTPTTSGTNNSTGFTLLSPSGCAPAISPPANSFCVIFPYNSGASHKYIFDVSNALINNQAYHLVLGVVEYTGPAIYNNANHISIGISEGATSQNFTWLYHSGNVTINDDQHSGSMDVVLASVHGGNTLHVVGNWACGRQIKNT